MRAMTRSLRVMACATLLALGCTAKAQTTLFSEDFSGTRNIFNVESTEPAAGKVAIFNSGLTGFGRVLNICNTSATCTITGRDGNAAQAVGKGAVTVEWDAFHGYWSKNQGATVTMKNSDGEALASYTYDAKLGQITAATIGGKTPDGFKAFAMSSGANGFSGNGKPYTATAGRHPHISMTLTAQGRLLMSFTVQGKTTTLQGSIGTLKNNIASVQFTSNIGNTDRCYAIDNFTVSTSDLSDTATDGSTILNAAITGAESMTFGANTSTAFKNPYSLYMIGNDGSTINAQTASKKGVDFNVVWDIEGFKTANDTEGQYCDSYGSFPTTATGSTSTTFNLCDVPMNFYGCMTATITYGSQTVKARKYVTALGNKKKTTEQVLPLAGYPADFTDYPAALDGYSLVASADGGGHDPITGGWTVAGSDAPDARLMTSDATRRYIKLMAATAGKTHMLSHPVSIADGQVIYDTQVRFHQAGTQLTVGPQPANNAQKSTAILRFTGSGLTLNGAALTEIDGSPTVVADQWYRIILSADKGNQQCFAKVYSNDGKLMAETPIMKLQNAGLNAYFGIGLEANSTGSVDMASCKAYTPTINTESYQLTTDKAMLSIPAGDQARLTVTATDTDGYPITDKATWTILEDDMRQSLIITPDADDNHQATLSLSSSADAGTATIQVSIGGVATTTQVTVLGDGESIKFTQYTQNITIPFDDAHPTEVVFAAQVVDGQGATVDRQVVLAAYTADGTKPFTNSERVKFDAATGILSIASSAQPTSLIIRGTCKDSDGKDLKKDVTVNIRPTSFVFDTPVTKYDIDIHPGAFYTVEITYQGVLTTGYINSDLLGYELGTNTTMKTVSYTVPGTTDKIDLQVATGENVSAAGITAINVTKQAPRKKRAKRVVHHIGDSTSANSGSWAYRLSGMSSTFPELFALCDFKNNGAGGRNLSTYYMQGKLYGVLLDIYPEDIVMFGNNGTNGMGNSYEADMNYYLDAAEALGAKIIINSYSPHGAVSNYSSGYNSTTHTFDSYRKDSYETIVRKVAAQREKSDNNYLGFVEIGKNADAAFNAYVADYSKNGYTSADAAAQAIINCFADHNHYNKGTLAGDLMLKGYGSVKGIVAQLTEILNNSQSTGVNTISQHSTANTQSPHAYTMNGIRIDKNKLHKGIYIIDGHKVAIR